MLHDQLASLLHVLLVKEWNNKRLLQEVPVCVLDAAVGHEYLLLSNKLNDVVGSRFWIDL